MYLNHPTQTEQYDRPERAVEDLVGKLTSDAVYESDGLYADVEFYDSFVAQINEKHEDIGLSVRAHGLTEDAEMEGRYGPVLVALLAADSVDVVTKAGAGGKLTSILESDRDLAGALIETNKEGTQSVADVTKEDFEALQTALIEAIAGIPAALAESLAAKPEAVVETVVEDAIVVEAVAAVVIDHAAVVEALATNHLPAASAGKIVSALTEGATLADAIAEQVTLREAFLATSTESGTVVINESDKTARGLSRAVSVLG
jgi:antitoxin component of MazEF toxin-antitoxin module